MFEPQTQKDMSVFERKHMMELTVFEVISHDVGRYGTERMGTKPLRVTRQLLRAPEQAIK